MSNNLQENNSRVVKRRFERRNSNFETIFFRKKNRFFISVSNRFNLLLAHISKYISSRAAAAGISKTFSPTTATATGLKVHLHKLHLTRLAAVRKNKNFPISAETQPSTAATRVKLSLCESASINARPSVTRFGEILPLLQTYANLCQVIEGLLSACKNFAPNLVKL